MDFNDEELQEEELAKFEDLGFNGESQKDPNNNDEVINENEPVEDPVSSDSENYESPIEDTKSQTKKKNLPDLIGKKTILKIMIVVVGLALITAILIFLMDWDIFGIGHPKPKYYQTPSCGKVYLTWEKESYTKQHSKDPDYEPITDPTLVDLSDDDRFEYKEYEYDKFVAGVIWTDNDKAMDVDNEVVYQAMAIAARSRLIAELSDNCVVLKDYNEQAKSFKELDGSEEKYTEITKAVSDSDGIIIGRNGKIISAKYDTFSYVSKRKENDAQYKDIFFYYMMNENKDRQQLIPANWVDNLEEEKRVEIPKTHVNSTLKLGSMSLYGAKYLLEQVDSQYKLYRILETYYGRDIEYYTINSVSFGGGFFGTSGCMWWPVGSLLTTEENGITFASGTPETTRITSQFGLRLHPIKGDIIPHNAIDIGGGIEGLTNIIAAADGEVTAVNTGCVAGNSSCGGGLGNYVKITHSDGTITRYGHMYSVSVSQGQQVKQGQVIGKMGNTGSSTGPHLDFQVIVNGTPVNPLNYISPTNPRSQCSYSIGITQGNNNAQTVCLSMKNQGYSNNAIAGMLGNLQAENSVFDPNVVNGIGCVGIVQWCGRQANLKSFAGSNWNTLEAQISFMFYELNGGYSGVKNYMQGDHSPSDIAHYICMYYEKPGESICNSGVRQGYANNWLSYVTNGCN